MSEGLKKVRETAEVVGLAKEVKWPVGPTPEPLVRKKEGSRDSESSEESDSGSSEDGSTPASSLSSPLRGNNNSILPLDGIDDITIDQKELTIRVLSRLRDLWELSNGCICLSDHYSPPSPPPEEMEIDDFAQEMGITLKETDGEEEKEEAIDVVKKVMTERSVKRANIIKEIIDTEETYIRGLQELVDVSLPICNADCRFILIILCLLYLRRTR